MKPNILTIVIPTFNRADYLENLLLNIVKQKEISRINFDLIVLNNNSEDGTKKLLDKYKNNFPFWTFLNRSENIGADANRLDALHLVKTKYCWIIGDDDLPMMGIISKVLEILGSSRDIGLIYLEPYWTANVKKIKSQKIKKTFFKLNNIQLASRTNIMTTFISSWIFNLKKYKEIDINLTNAKTFINTDFIQLSWILPLLESKGLTYYSSRGSYILATKDNTNPYKILDSFLFVFPETVNKLISDKLIQDKLLINFLSFYMPKLILSVKTGFFKQNIKQNNKDIKISNQLKKYTVFSILIKPILFISDYIPIQVIQVLSKFLKIVKLFIFKFINF